MRLQTEFADAFDVATVERLVCSSYEKLAAHATVFDFLPLLAERFARQQLHAIAKINGKSNDYQLVVLFLCNHNAGRSQMAMGFFNHLAGGGAVVWSGGSEPTGEINPAAITAMAERGIDISGRYPKPWTGEIIQAAGQSATRSNAACAGYSTTCEFPTGPDPHRARDQFVQDDVLVFGLVVIVALFATVIVGTVLGHRYRVGPPVLLILLGALLGLIPQFGGVRLDGEIVLLLFLPAILYWESLNTSFREIRKNLRVIVFLSVGLVIATAVAVTWTARAMGMESHAASVLGAVLSPTDAAAVAGLAKQLPRRAVTVLKAESIINDGTALVLFGVSVAVAVGGNPISPAALTARFLASYLGAICAGLLVGLAVTLVRRRLDAPQEEGALSLLTPFAAFLLAQSIDCSGVVAVLVSALVMAYASPYVIRARSRLQTFAFWDLATFLINGSLWVFVGVQMPHAVRGIAGVDGGIRHAALLALAVIGVILVTRFACIESITALLRAVDRRAVQRTRRVDWRQRIVSGWAGFRGAVSLAAALAVPLTTHGGAPFPDRNLIIFVVCIVILVTVLVQGSTLSAVVRWARMPEDVSRADELQLARCRGVQAALEALPVVAGEVGVSEELLRRLQKEYQEHAALVEAGGDAEGPNEVAERNDLLRRVRLGVLEHKRRAIIELRDQNRIDDIILRELQSAMDLEEVRLLDPADTG